MDQLKTALEDKSSPIYNSSNWREIKDFLWQRGFPIEKKTIINYLEKQRHSLVKYKNEGSQKISEMSKPFVMRHQFFSILHADTMVLSKKRRYGSLSPYVLVCICQLSRYIHLEPCKSLKFKSQKRAWEKIFLRIEKAYPGAKVSNVITDNGPENKGKLRSWFNSLSIKLNNVKLRPFRLSLGSGVAESCIRRVRIAMEKVMNKSSSQPFSETIQLVEQMCNNQYLSSIKMSAIVALQHTPMYVAMMSETVRQKRRKLLRKELIEQKELKQFAIVCVKKFQQKLFTSTRKESYGHQSPCFMISRTLKDRPILRYKLKNLFTLIELPGTYSRAELVLLKMNYVEACAFEERNIEKVVDVKGNIVSYNVVCSDRLFTASKGLID